MSKHKNKKTDQSKNVMAMLSRYGHIVEDHSKSWSPFDILMDRKIKIEVKTGSYRVQSKIWAFNIHRHNVLNEDGLDFYVLRFLDIPGTKRAINALYKAPLKTPTMQFSMRELLAGKISQAVKDFRKLNLRSKKSSS